MWGRTCLACAGCVPAEKRPIILGWWHARPRGNEFIAQVFRILLVNSVHDFSFYAWQTQELCRMLCLESSLESGPI